MGTQKKRYHDRRFKPHAQSYISRPALRTYVGRPHPLIYLIVLRMLVCICSRGEILHFHAHDNARSSETTDRISEIEVGVQEMRFGISRNDTMWCEGELANAPFHAMAEILLSCVSALLAVPAYIWIMYGIYEEHCSW